MGEKAVYRWMRTAFWREMPKKAVRWEDEGEMYREMRGAKGSLKLRTGGPPSRRGFVS